MQKSIALAFVAMATLIVSSASSVDACTGIRLSAKDGTVVHARSLEFVADLESNIIVLPRGMEFTGSLPNGKPGMTWTSKYGVVGANAVGKPVIVDGVNEKGLAVGLFFFPGFAQFQTYDKAQASRTISPLDMATWMLTNFATVEEVRNALAEIRVVMPNYLTAGSKQTYHFDVVDAQGNNIAIDPIGGELKVFDNTIGVMTNVPAFDWHMTNLRNYINLTPVNAPPVNLRGVELKALSMGTGFLGSPGDWTSPSRFVRAAFFSGMAVPVQTDTDVVLQAFHILNNFDIPMGSVRTSKSAKKGIEYTQWTSVADLKHKRFYMRTYDDMSIKMVDLMKMDLNAPTIKTINLKGDTPFIDVTDRAK